jgi:hypothetical protein
VRRRARKPDSERPLIRDRDARLYEELAHQIAMEASRNRELTPELREVSRRLHEAIHRRLDAMERNELVRRAAERRRTRRSLPR